MVIHSGPRILVFLDVLGCPDLDPVSRDAGTNVPHWDGWKCQTLEDWNRMDSSNSKRGYKEEIEQNWKMLLQNYLVTFYGWKLTCWISGFPTKMPEIQWCPLNTDLVEGNLRVSQTPWHPPRCMTVSGRCTHWISEIVGTVLQMPGIANSLKITVNSSNDKKSMPQEWRVQETHTVLFRNFGATLKVPGMKAKSMLGSLILRMYRHLYIK